LNIPYERFLTMNKTNANEYVIIAIMTATTEEEESMTSTAAYTSSVIIGSQVQ